MLQIFKNSTPISKIKVKYVFIWKASIHCIRHACIYPIDRYFIVFGWLCGALSRGYIIASVCVRICASICSSICVSICVPFETLERRILGHTILAIAHEKLTNFYHFHGRKLKMLKMKIFFHENMKRKTRNEIIISIPTSKCKCKCNIK